MAERTSLIGPLLISLLAAAVLAGGHSLTAERIAANEQAEAQRQIRELLDRSAPALELNIGEWQGDTLLWCVHSLAVSRLRATGYAGSIDLLVAWASDEPARTLGVTIVRHLETPGIADFLNNTGEDGWLDALVDTTARTLPDVDTVTGATVSSRGVKRALLSTLENAPAMRARCPG